MPKDPNQNRNKQEEPQLTNVVKKHDIDSPGNIPDTVVVQSLHTPAAYPAVPSSCWPNKPTLGAPILRDPSQLLFQWAGIAIDVTVRSIARWSCSEKPVGAPQAIPAWDDVVALTKCFFIAHLAAKVARVSLGSKQSHKHEY